MNKFVHFISTLALASLIATKLIEYRLYQKETTYSDSFNQNN